MFPNLALSLAVAALALVGHSALWVGVVNRWHAIGFPRRVIKTVTLAFYAALVLIPLAVAGSLARSGASAWQPAEWLGQLNWATAYLAFCAAYGAVHIPFWAFGRLAARRLPAGVRRQRDELVDTAAQLGGSPARGARAVLFSRIPFNQLAHLYVGQFEVDVPRLPPALSGLSICHLSDLHFSGRLDRSYYDEVVRRTNELGADLIVLTGDVCDRARYIEWIAMLDGLSAPLGKFFILGNHDVRTRAVERVRGAMCEAGFVDVGGRRTTIADGAIAVAGNERPWLNTPLPAIGDLPGETLKILLSHTPDHLAWARRQGFDLMFAGHTHGGQIRLPLVGPLVCPSWHGTRYSAGFFCEPPTLLHVSRGTGTLFPYRLLCPPEITRVALRTP